MNYVLFPKEYNEFRTYTLVELITVRFLNSEEYPIIFYLEEPFCYIPLGKVYSDFAITWQKDDPTFVGGERYFKVTN